jgi:hypothetical protein
MPINKNNKLGFIHIPRTGGTYIEYLMGVHENRPGTGLDKNYNKYGDVNYLFGRNMQHLTFQDIINLVGENCNNYYWFSIIRSPKDRLISIFNHTFKCPLAVSNPMVLLFCIMKIFYVKIFYLLQKTFFYYLISGKSNQINIDVPIIQHIRKQQSYITLSPKYFEKNNITPPNLHLFPFEALSVLNAYIPALTNADKLEGRIPNASKKKYRKRKFNLFIINLLCEVFWAKDVKLYKRVYKEWTKNNQPIIKQIK